MCTINENQVFYFPQQELLIFKPNSLTQANYISNGTLFDEIYIPE